MWVVTFTFQPLYPQLAWAPKASEPCGKINLLPYRESIPDSTVVQPVTYSLYWAGANAWYKVFQAKTKILPNSRRRLVIWRSEQALAVLQQTLVARWVSFFWNESLRRCDGNGARGIADRETDRQTGSCVCVCVCVCVDYSCHGDQVTVFRLN
jgi:hypothetical protein